MILLDTCALIWDALAPDRLTPNARLAIDGAIDGAIHDAGRELMICDISIWEIAILMKKGRLVVDETPSGFINLLIEARNLHIQGITPEIAELSVNLGPEINNDPADRLIATTSILMSAPIVTADRNLRQSAMLETIW
uniref:PIN domain nuclease, a component of toxin-antitoxin system (PIN domain) n=1 Tax=Candidatus Kentrum sp. FM TaxID=2126340 RepID=A0A450U0P3_9GAMM|nr:MAG: PIN domain nuclease, a component of toxin-antitoxin system (PIN domain) [Candidatus Kentron sp. FM]VFJ76996.1 MAG: PIN domain nuclease, a component of toxin-antitoxin system (PIN domain) [Candidatus Kentron sp. FM]VFK22766.1 MAG: PIN domain nuclease, a component of toxin-antitoxin system (PIN domain) [Candidatus Kentron sp. FM]